MTNREKATRPAAMAIVVLALGSGGCGTIESFFDARECRDSLPYRSSVQLDPESGSGASLASRARIDADSAAALARLPGTIDDIELENECGNLIYEVGIEGADGDDAEIVVDADDGRILHVG